MTLQLTACPPSSCYFVHSPVQRFQLPLHREPNFALNFYRKSMAQLCEHFDLLELDESNVLTWHRASNVHDVAAEISLEARNK